MRFAAARRVGSIELLGGSDIDWREASWREGVSGSGSLLAYLGLEDEAAIWLDKRRGVVAPPLFRTRIGLAEHF
jgi:hypothetical protein